MAEKEIPTKNQSKNIYKAGTYYGTISIKEFGYR
jgi:hypothetical protein